MTICCVIITDGRKHCFERTVNSWVEAWNGQPLDEVVIINDAADQDYTDWLDERYPDYWRVHHESRRGFGGAIQSAWLRVGHYDWVFHLEDDFTFNEPIDVTGMITVLQARLDVVQMALKRQPWNPEEQAAGGFMEQHLDDYHDETTDGYAWCWQRRFFTTNPSLYHGTLTEQGWPQVKYSEGIFSMDMLRDPHVKFGFWGHKHEPPKVHHIGDERIGTGY